MIKLLYLAIFGIFLLSSEPLHASPTTANLQIKIGLWKTDGNIQYDAVANSTFEVNAASPLSTYTAIDGANKYCEDFAGKGFAFCDKKKVDESGANGTLITPVGGYVKSGLIHNSSVSASTCVNWTSNAAGNVQPLIKLNNGVVEYVNDICSSANYIACCKYSD